MKHPMTVEDYVEWTTDENNKKFIRVLGVSYFFCFCFCFVFSEFILISCNY